MKKNQFILPLIIGFFIITSGISAQENNYITSKYDFIPGEKVIFFDDFASEGIGDFPAQWLTNGSGEIVTLEKFPGKWLHITKMGYFIPEAKEDFTENFTIEFDFVPLTTEASENMYSFTFYLLSGILSEPGGGGEPGDAGFLIYLDNLNIFWKNWSAETGQRFDGMVGFPFRQNEKYHVALWIQKQRVRMYANENKVLDVPRAIPAGSLPNIFRFESDQVSIPLISNFRIAAGLPDMRSRLMKDGKIVSYGILFDVNSDKLKPESYATLKVISDILKEDPSLKLKVVGHTDSDGDDASNLDLSKRRAASVKNELVSKFGADASRLETDGKGESEPINDNNSSVNKAKNRRVEFINLKGSLPGSTVAAVTATTAAVVTTSKAAADVSGTKSVANETGALTDIDGNSYKIVTIGSQIWMAENLKTTKFSDGSPIPYVPNDAEWGKMESPAYCWMNNEVKYKNTYGALYNWYTVSTLKLCPAGWHIPDDGEWEVLRQYLSGDEGSDNEGGMLKESGTAHWASPNLGATNETGFTGLPGGGRGHDGTFDEDIYGFGSVGTDGSWWSYTKQAQDGSYYMGLKSDSKGLFTGASSATSYGISARCVKDK